MSQGQLGGRVVVTTRGDTWGDRLSAGLSKAGAHVLHWQTSSYPPPADPQPLRAALADLDGFDWVVFTSPRAVAAVADLSPASPIPRVSPTPRVAVVGPATGRAATEAGWKVAVQGAGPGAHGLAASVASIDDLDGSQVLFPAASEAAPTVEEEFTSLGADVHRVQAYRTVIEPPDPARVRSDLEAGVDAITFASPSAVEAVDLSLDLSLARALAGLAVVCIGPTTAAALDDRGVADVVVAETSTLEGMIQVLIERLGTLSEPDTRPSGGRT